MLTEIRNIDPSAKGSAAPTGNNEKVGSIVSEADRLTILIYICLLAGGNEC